MLAFYYWIQVPFLLIANLCTRIADYFDNRAMTIHVKLFKKAYPNYTEAEKMRMKFIKKEYRK